MEELAERVHGDIRMALNHLQYMSLSQSVVKYDDIKQRLTSSAKDEDISPFTAVDKYFLSLIISSIQNITMELLSTSSFILYLIFLIDQWTQLFNFRCDGWHFIPSFVFPY